MPSGIHHFAFRFLCQVPDFQQNTIEQISVDPRLACCKHQQPKPLGSHGAVLVWPRWFAWLLLPSVGDRPSMVSADVCLSGSRRKGESDWEGVRRQTRLAFATCKVLKVDRWPTSFLGHCGESVRDRKKNPGQSNAPGVAKFWRLGFCSRAAGGVGGRGAAGRLAAPRRDQRNERPALGQGVAAISRSIPMPPSPRCMNLLTTFAAI
jgi:hypothetical protein